MGRQKPVKIFVMGKNVWRQEDSWPLARARETRYYLHSAGKANTLSGDGTLSTLAPGTEPADQYLCDPANPAPTRGGPLRSVPGYDTGRNRFVKRRDLPRPHLLFGLFRIRLQPRCEEEPSLEQPGIVPLEAGSDGITERAPERHVSLRGV